MLDIELLEEERADAGKATESEATSAESTEKSTELTMKDTDAKDKGTTPESKHAEPKTIGREPKDKAPVDAGSKAKKYKKLKEIKLSQVGRQLMDRKLRLIAPQDKKNCQRAGIRAALTKTIANICSLSILISDKRNSVSQISRHHHLGLPADKLESRT